MPSWLEPAAYSGWAWPLEHQLAANPAIIASTIAAVAQGQRFMDEQKRLGAYER